MPIERACVRAFVRVYMYLHALTSASLQAKIFYTRWQENRYNINIQRTLNSTSPNRGYGVDWTNLRGPNWAPTDVGTRPCEKYTQDSILLYESFDEQRFRQTETANTGTQNKLQTNTDPLNSFHLKLYIVYNRRQQRQLQKQFARLSDVILQTSEMTLNADIIFTTINAGKYEVTAIFQNASNSFDPYSR